MDNEQGGLTNNLKRTLGRFGRIEPNLSIRSCPPKGDKMDKLIGTGQYIAYQSHLACKDERESFWRLSKVTLSQTKLGEMTFTYVGEFATQTDIEQYLRDIPQEMSVSVMLPNVPKPCFCDYCYEVRNKALKHD